MTLPSVGVFLFFSLLHASAGAGGGGGPVPPAAASSGPSAAAARAALLKRVDALYAGRDDRRTLDEQRQFLDGEVARAPNDYDLMWRAARLYFWLGDDPSLPSDQRSKLGKTGWELAERAVALAPDRPDGHYWAAVNIGNYALGLGVVKALASGLEGKFREHLSRAEALAPAYNHGGVNVAWGRFYEKLPWPKRDRAKAQRALRRVLAEQNPGNLRARVYLAETLTADGHADEAKRLLDEVAAAPLGRYDVAEEHRAKALGDGLRPKVMKALEP